MKYSAVAVADLFPSTLRPRNPEPSPRNNPSSRQPSPHFLNKEELKILAEGDIYRKPGERVEDALYRDY